jgi:hypothetical protein
MTKNGEIAHMLNLTTHHRNIKDNRSTPTHILNLSIRWSASCPDRFTSGTYLYNRLDGSDSQSRREIASFPYRELIPNSSVLQPIA